MKAVHVSRFDVLYDKRMSATTKGQISRKCNTKNIFFGLLSVMIIGILAMCQVLYNRDFVENTMEPRPQVQAIRGPIKVTRTQLSLLHVSNLVLTNKGQTSNGSTKKPLAKKNKKNTSNKKAKRKGITSNIIIEGQINHANKIPLKKKANVQDEPKTERQSTFQHHAGKVTVDVSKATIKTTQMDTKELKGNIQSVHGETDSANMKKFSQSTVRQNRKPSATNNHPKCPDVLRLMSVGKWIKKRTSKAEIDYTDKFLEDTRKQLRIHGSLSRPDGRCGNIGLPGLPYTRALCNPKGDKPCCHENTCKALSIEQCRCEHCYDVRQRIHAEHATWTPEDSRCTFKNFTASEACSLLSGAQLYLVGDSFMRHLYSAFLMVVRNDGRFGALKSSLSKEYRSRCEGMYSFGSKECRPTLEPNPDSLCNGTFKLIHISHSKSVWAPQFLQLVNRTLGKDKVLIMPGLGVHENCNATKTKQYLEKSIHLLKSNRAKWPKLVWATTHAPGLLKAPLLARREFHQVDAFNKEMTKYLTLLGIPVFDTFNMTSETASFDGTHYGLGVNVAKVQLFLNYLQEQRNRRQW